VRIRLKYSTTVAFSWQEDKDETNKQTNKQIDSMSAEDFCSSHVKVLKMNIMQSDLLAFVVKVRLTKKWIVI